MNGSLLGKLDEKLVDAEEGTSNTRLHEAIQRWAVNLMTRRTGALTQAVLTW
jgi:hypothetical protein